jgi:phosphatidylinositol glycan class K
MMFILLWLANSLSRNYAVLLNASKNYENYRHFSNVFTFNEILKKNGYKNEDILYLVVEDISQDIRNTRKGYIHHKDDVFFRMGDVYTSDISVNHFANILKCNHVKLNMLDETSNVFLYMCGHGGRGFIKFLDRECLYRRDLMVGICGLSKRVNKVLLIIDTCQAQSLVDIGDVPYNVFIVVTSKCGEPSISCSKSEKIGPFLVDNFPFVFYEKHRSGVNANLNLEEFFDTFGYESIGSHLEYYNGGTLFTYGDFFVQDERKEALLPFKEDT